MDEDPRESYYVIPLPNLPINLIAAFEIRRHEPEWGGQDLCGSNPQKMGSENLSNLSGYVLVEHWLWVRVSF